MKRESTGEELKAIDEAEVRILHSTLGSVVKEELCIVNARKEVVILDDEEDEIEDVQECINKVLNHNNMLMSELVDMKCTLLETEYLHWEAEKVKLRLN